MAIRKKKIVRKKSVKRIFRGLTKNAIRKNASVKKARKVVARKKNRQDIHRIVRDHIRAGRNQKQILDLMKRAGFKKEYLAEARKIYNSEKRLVKQMRTGRKNPKLIVKKGYRIRDKFGKWHTVISVNGNIIKVSGGTVHRSNVVEIKKNPSKVVSTIKRVAVKASKTAIGAVKGAIKGGVRAAKANPAKVIAKYFVGKGWRKGEWNGEKYVYVGSFVSKREDLKIPGFGKIKPPKRKRNSPIAEQQRKQFAGHFDGYRDLYYPSTNPPKEPSKLGELKSIRTSKADFNPIKGSMWLVRDSIGHLHIGTTRQGEMFAGPVQDLGVVERIEYLERKPHLGDYQLTEYYHRMGEESGIKPHLWSDGKGGLVFRGGDYRIESRGIVN